jgi:hypothetical protein
MRGLTFQYVRFFAPLQLDCQLVHGLMSAAAGELSESLSSRRSAATARRIKTFVLCSPRSHRYRAIWRFARQPALDRGKHAVIGELPGAYAAPAYSKPMGLRLNTRLTRTASSVF